MRSLLLFLVYSCLLRFSLAARHTLKVGQSITDDESTNLVSVGGNFELGFFSLSSGSPKAIYLGIWYHRLKVEAEGAPEQRTFVWVANREKPIIHSAGVFQIAEDGNLQVLGTDGRLYWSLWEHTGTSTKNGSVMLMDSGNLVFENEFGKTVWQSFEHPTDTFLPGMKMSKNLKLISWSGSDDPAPGKFAFKQGKIGQSPFIITKSLQKLHWESGALSSTAIPPKTLNLLTNFTLNSSRYQLFNSSKGGINVVPRPLDYQNKRIVMNFTGKIQTLSWDNATNSWALDWEEPSDKCKTYNSCGNFSSCNIKRKSRCSCLPGFSPKSARDLDFSEGCVRKSTWCTREDLTFLNLTNVKVRKSDRQVTATSETECQSECLNTWPNCQAYSYNTSRWSDRTNSSACLIWTEDLTTLIEQDAVDGSVISLPLKGLDLAPISRGCKPCGTNIVPFPLSTGANCGDPMYFKFNCSYSTGELTFMMLRRNYLVTSMDPVNRKFSVQIEDPFCDNSDQEEWPSFPFNVTEGCSGDSGDSTIEVSWTPPLEQLCNESSDCKDWPHSTCKATATGDHRCLCNSKFHWDPPNLICAEDHNAGKRLSLILVVVLTIVIFMTFTIAFAYVWKRKASHRQDIGSVQRIRETLHDSERHVKSLIGLGALEEKDNEGIDVPYFDFESILAATDNFSDVHKLGQGGFGPVYKGKFPGGQDIAVKRLSSVSSQGLQEFKNEVVLIAKLQHRNLVRLQGYCIKGDEKILLYEYMPNKSLDSIIFDRTQRILLDWEMRLDIIIGVARGLLYLHHDSRLRVIHRDLKTSNILLDEEMKPKISDFGLARIFGGKETEANTERVVGTYGYMSPEYALDGFFSIKSDVFSFGVVLLEIISAKKNTGFYKSRQASSLLGYAWTLWADNKLLDIMDPSLSETCNTNQFIRCAIVGLLCVQDEPSDRPTMSNVVTMLDSEAMTLPIPKQPTFFTSRGLSSTGSSSSKPETSLQIDSSCQEGR